MQTCPNCGEANQDTARFCQACGTPLAPPVEEVKLPAESRKMVTLVFCDLTGSTALGEKMDPESLRRVVTRIEIAEIRQCPEVRIVHRLHHGRKDIRVR